MIEEIYSFCTVLFQWIFSMLKGILAACYAPAEPDVDRYVVLTVCHQSGWYLVPLLNLAYMLDFALASDLIFE